MLNKANFKYTPIKEIFERKLCSKPTFYKYLKQGLYSVYKFGSRSYVDLDEFENSFIRINLKAPDDDNKKSNK
jgi:hypothetical protein